MKIKKRSLFLAVALIALMTGVLSAQTYDSESDFQVTKNGNAITITKYVGTKTAVSIPPTIQNTPVTAIGNNAFNSANITSVTIPNSVKSIGTAAFFATKLTSITIPASVQIIEINAFNGYTSLTSVTFQDAMNVGQFVSNAFSIDNDLHAKFLATSKTSGTQGTYTRPNGTSGTWTLTATTSTASAQYDSESDFQVTKTGNSITITKYVGNKTVINIPPSIQNTPVTAIGDNAFNGDTKITSVTSIGMAAFARCINLASVTIGSGVTNIGNGAFAACTNLFSVTFQNTITQSNFVTDAFPGSVRSKFYATDETKGTLGTYAKTGTTWAKK